MPLSPGRSAEQAVPTLKDAFGRVINNLRISVTDRCNFRCRYCMPEDGMQWMERSALLTFEEITRLVRIFSALGIDKIRLTGGEPLMRRDLPELVRQIRTVKGIGDLGVTTNGFFLAGQAQALFNAGLRRVNVSLDSLDPGRFKEMTRRDLFTRVWEGIEAADAAGFRPIKLNAVMVRGVNDGEIPAFAQVARSRPFVIRFIEFMPIGADDGWTPERVVPAAEIIGRMERATGRRLISIERHGAQPSDRFRFDDGAGEIGFIASVSEPFCTSCNRVRITSDGKLRTCLFSLDETDLRGPLRAGASDDELRRMIVDAVHRKEAGHLINRPEFVRPSRSMSQIGG